MPSRLARGSGGMRVFMAHARGRLWRNESARTCVGSNEGACARERSPPMGVGRQAIVADLAVLSGTALVSCAARSAPSRHGGSPATPARLVVVARGWNEGRPWRITVDPGAGPLCVGEAGYSRPCAGLRGLERGNGLAVLSGAEVAVRLRHPRASAARARVCLAACIVRIWPLLRRSTRRGAPEQIEVAHAETVGKFARVRALLQELTGHDHALDLVGALVDLRDSGAAPSFRR
jgi:hypothetical protein